MPYAIACKLPNGLLVGGMKLNGFAFDRTLENTMYPPEHVAHGWGITQDVPDHIAQQIPESFINNGSVFASTDLGTVINYARAHGGVNHMGGAARR